MAVLSRIRITSHESPKNCTVPLSILDAAVARFAPTSAVWLFEKSLPTSRLGDSLKATVQYYPQWAGQLRYAEPNNDADHTHRPKRLLLEYGTNNDPGVELIIADSPSTIHRLTSLRDDKHGILDVTNMPIQELLDPSPPLALQNVQEFMGLPCMIVQITTLADGGTAIAVRMSHPIADAQTMIQFMRDWTQVHEALSQENPCPALNPLFTPQLIDLAASGDIDSIEPDPSILEIARNLPLHRFDWWASSAGCPDFFVPATQVPPEAIPARIESVGTPIAWSEWDYTVPVSHKLITFNAEEMRNIWMEASSVSRVSHLDALLAHLWALIGCARDIGDSEEFYLDNSFGFRKRLDPPLPSTFLGSPLTIAKVVATGDQAKRHDIGSMAANIRSALGSLNRATLPALLHEMVHYSSAQRYWNGFLGNRNTIVTSWLGLGARQIDFGSGNPVYADAIIPPCDGCLQLMEAYATGDTQASTDTPWYNESVNVSLYLREDIMESVLNNPNLRKFRNV